MRWSFLSKPRWLLGHFVILLCCVVFVNCAIWQYHRLHQRQASNRSIETQLALPPVADLTSAPQSWRHIRLTGRWDEAHVVLQRYPLRDGVSGYDVLVPLLSSDGSTYVVNQGFVPMDRGDALQRGSVSGDVTVEGLVRSGEHTSKEIGATKAGVPTITSVDLDRLAEPMGTSRLAGSWVQLTSPVADGGPLPLTDPEITEGPHRSYMYQWISFTILAVVGWAVVLRREAREQNDLADP